MAITVSRRDLRHRWDITPAEAIALQRRLAGKVRILPLRKEIRTVAGADCAFVDDGKTTIAAAVLCRADSMEVISVAEASGPCDFPYVPGLLSFREAPVVIAAIEKLPAFDLLMCDGQGVAHPRGLGLASHVGIWLDAPTIGVAKSRLVGEHRPPGQKRRCRTQLRHEGRVIGAVVRTRTSVRPLFVSVGHRITLDDAVKWTLRSTRGVRLPQPTRIAHQYVTKMKKRSHIIR